MSNNVPFNFANIQTKLKVSQPDDVYEQEADRVAEQVNRMSFSDSVSRMSTSKQEGIDRSCSTCEMEEEEDGKIEIGRKPTTTSNLEKSDQVANGINNIRSSSGSPLSQNTREFMESRIGHDFSKVKIYSDETAARSASLINALAYTMGNNIVFGQGQYQPLTFEGRMLLAHELTHVVQQNNYGSANRLYIQRQAIKERKKLKEEGKRRELEEYFSPAAIKRRELEEYYSPAAIKERKKLKEERFKQKHEIIDDTMKRFRGDTADRFLNEWMGQVDKGIDTISVPNKEQSKIYWWLALAGNLLWAATSLMVPGLINLGKGAIIIASFLGATIGSGALTPEPPSLPPDGKTILRTRLSQVRDEMSQKIYPLAEKAAWECGRRNITDVQDQNEILWRTMFADVPYNNRFEHIMKTSITQASSALDDYNKQYDEYVEELKQYARTYGVGFRPYCAACGDLRTDKFFGTYDLSKEQVLNLLAKAFPFSPQLHFSFLKEPETTYIMGEETLKGITIEAPKPLKGE
jgi:hypothetical protein